MDSLIEGCFQQLVGLVYLQIETRQALLLSLKAQKLMEVFFFFGRVLDEVSQYLQKQHKHGFIYKIGQEGAYLKDDCSQH